MHNAFLRAHREQIDQGRNGGILSAQQGFIARNDTALTNDGQTKALAINHQFKNTVADRFRRKHRCAPLFALALRPSARKPPRKGEVIRTVCAPSNGSGLVQPEVLRRGSLKIHPPKKNHALREQRQAAVFTARGTELSKVVEVEEFDGRFGHH